MVDFPASHVSFQGGMISWYFLHISKTQDHYPRKLSFKCHFAVLIHPSESSRHLPGSRCCAQPTSALTMHRMPSKPHVPATGAKAWNTTQTYTWHVLFSNVVFTPGKKKLVNQQAIISSLKKKYLFLPDAITESQVRRVHMGHGHRLVQLVPRDLWRFEIGLQLNC